MRKSLKTPRILQINAVKAFKIYCVFNNGEHRFIDFTSFFEEWQLAQHPEDFRYSLLDPKVFQTVSLNNNTLSWSSIRKSIKLSSGEVFEAVFELDPAVLYQASEVDEERNHSSSIGKYLKAARQEAGFTQEELAQRSGTTRYYISRIENNRSDIELGTLRKIVEIGLQKKLEIRIQ